MGGRLLGSISVLRTRYSMTLCCHLMTRSARANTFGGIVRPICLAAFRLMMNSNFVGCSTGRSAGFLPLRILSTSIATRRLVSTRSTPYDMRPPASASALLLCNAGSRILPQVLLFVLDEDSEPRLESGRERRRVAFSQRQIGFRVHSAPSLLGVEAADAKLRPQLPSL